MESSNNPAPVPRGGGGVLSLKKGTDCGPTVEELLLSRVDIAEKGGGGGLSSH